MDPITHAALGAACAEAVLFKKDRKNAWIAGGLAALAPDLDIFIHSAQDPMLGLLYHRHFTHSLSFIPIGALVVGLFLLLFKRFRAHWPLSFMAAFIGYATHSVLDASTSYGTILFWPFSDQRFSWDLVSIIDPLVTIPLVLGLAWTLIHKTRAGVLFGLGFVALFFLFNSFQHHRALAISRSYAQEQGWQPSRIRLIPFLASSTQWRMVSQVNDHLFVANVYTPLTRAGKLTAIAKLPLFLPEQLINFPQLSAEQKRDFAIFNWFSDGYLVLAQKAPLTLADGRYLWGDDPIYSLWGIQFLAERPHVVQQKLIKLEPIK